jgi:colicin import membrane protein
MTATMVIGNSDDLTEIRWPPMVTLSVSLHLIVFFIILFMPESDISWRQIEGTVYEVNLVEMPLAAVGSQDTANLVEKRGDTVISKENQAKRINVPEKQEKPLVVAKKTVTKKETQPKSSSQLIDIAIAKIEKKVKTEDKDHVEKAISQLKRKVEGRSNVQGGTRGVRSHTDITYQIYQMEATNLIYSNWSYPVVVQNLKKLQAIVVVKVKQDGTILESWFKERSRDAIFDQSVLKAIEKSGSLPPLSEGLFNTYGNEIEIKFNLKDLEEE